MDYKNSVNFHSYIDGKPNILLIIKLLNGNLLAGYTKYSFEPNKTKHTSGGIIMSLTNKKAFYQNTNKDKAYATVYDPYFIIFGNSEIRLRF